MCTDVIVDRLYAACTAGDRPLARTVVSEQFEEGISAEVVLTDLLWQVYERVKCEHREDLLPCLPYRLATRLLRVLADQVASRLRLDGTGPGVGRSVFIVCGPSECDELGGQMAVDLLEHYGFRVCFPGGGVPADEIRAAVQTDQPDVLLMFCAGAADLPMARGLIDTLHEVGACPRMQIVAGGGVFNRAEGLAEEIGADLWAMDPLELVQIMIDDAEHRQRAGARPGTKQRGLKRAA